MSDRASPAPGALSARLRRAAPLLRVLTVREFRLRYRQSVLNLAWGFVNPVVILLVYGIVLHNALHVSGDGVPYLSFAWTGLVAWTFFSASNNGAVSSLVGSADLMSKVYFPREVIPISFVGATLADLFIGLVTVVIIALIQGVSLSWTALGVVLPIAVLIVWSAALAALMAAIAVFIRDVTYVVQLGLRVGVFASPVMYPISVLPRGLQWTGSVNPIAVCIDGMRDCLLRSRWPDLPVVGGQGLAGVALLLLAILYTRSVEARMVDVV